MNRNYGHVNRIHWSFTFLYGIFTSILITGNVIWVGKQFIFQSGILGFFTVITGLLIASLITGELISNKRQKILIYQRVSISTIILSFLSILMIGIYLYNLMYILINICPKQNHPIDITNNNNIDNINNNHIEIFITYTHIEKEGDERRDIFLLNYNKTINKIMTREKEKGNNKNWLETEFEDIIYSNYNKEHICLNQTYSRYFFIENELKEILNYNRHQREESKVFKIKSTDIKILEEDEDNEIFLNFFSRHICKYEYAFMIIAISFLFLMAFLNIMTIGFYIWIHLMKL